MTDEAKWINVKTICDLDNSCEENVKAYIKLAEQEILEWLYSQVGGVPEDVEALPKQYELTQIYAVVNGYSHQGSDGQTNHSENGISRTFKYADMLDYIHRNVFPIVRVR